MLLAIPSLLKEGDRWGTIHRRRCARSQRGIKSLYRSRGIACAGDAVYRPGKRDAYVKELPKVLQTTALLLGRELDALAALQEEARKALLRDHHPHELGLGEG